MGAAGADRSGHPVSGNIHDEQCGFPSEAVIEMAGRRIAIRHILYEGVKLTKDGRALLDRERPDICVFGHTHQPKVEWFDKTLLFNPGSAGPKRFKLPRGLGILQLENRIILALHFNLPIQIEKIRIVSSVAYKYHASSFSCRKITFH